jgi:hypothetical protein
MTFAEVADAWHADPPEPVIYQGQVVPILKAFHPDFVYVSVNGGPVRVSPADLDPAS